MSFGMIFSIILIIIFIAFAFYAIQKFLKLQENIKIEQFLNNLQSDIDKVWRGSQASQQVEYSLPKKIASVCFKDDEDKNLFFRSSHPIGGRKIEHIDIDKITGGRKEFCIDNDNGKIKMIIKKNFTESLVTITK